MLSMQGLALDPSELDLASFNPSRDEFHTNMAIILDLAFAIFAEKRFLLYEDYNEQTSPINIIKLCQTLSSFTDPSLWGSPDKRYMAYGVSNLRRYLSFGCFRNYELGIQAFKDVYLACLSLGPQIFSIILTELSSLMDDSTDLDLRWVNEAVLNDSIMWCTKLEKASKTNDEMRQYWNEFVE